MPPVPDIDDPTTFDAHQQQRAIEVVRRSRLSVQTVCLLVLTILAVFYTLYFAAAIILPIVLALVVNLLLSAPMRMLHFRLRLPKTLAALLLILCVFGVVGAIGTAISVPAAGWIARAPQTMAALQAHLVVLRGPIQMIQAANDRIANFLSVVGGQRSHGGGAQVVLLAPSSTPGGGLGTFGSSVLLGTRAFVGQLFTMMLMLFFLLAQGDSLLRRFVEIMPTFADKRRAVQIAYQIERNVSLYLTTITIINVLVGLANMLQCWVFGLPNPLLWGVVAFLLNYIPIIGPMTGIVIYFVVSLFVFPSILQALLPPAVYLCIHLMEGETITPMVLARRFTLNPVLVMGSLMFWDWLWGVWGAFLSVPLLAVFKIICDHVDVLTPIGHIVGGPTRPRTVQSAIMPGRSKWRAD
ncbi:AI-2E family transporter [Gluconacetobacter azotocaptans]|uniref:AI-2E family transporter n=1 Tax=Gluconacetobacter azotocaptans TaxID=142834 RepID=A0A7W4JQX8_9PROT|nr:AI-2E family transporter [Gluconacetobacter azotocaptans]MBB2189289.1 AI-2E family transporter [Gluconacetobacter azotocaptans]MBM9402088.1 AI-2E family transporter [Gluconacetobacter azotocaptans]GBQ32508.1 transporter [Gluconacetobacter azotocaptans DSM 13594]